MKKLSAILGSLLLVAGVAVVLDDGASDGPIFASGPTCGPGKDSVSAASGSVGAGTVAGYSGVQLENASRIIAAGKAMGLSVKGQTIGVMTAMGESGLKVLDYGDGPGPDSRGLFQQRSAGWGSYQDRMDPGVSAANFFKALQKVPGWGDLPPTLAANRTQHNADPYHYEPYWAPATEVYKALSGEIVPPAAGCGGAADAAGDGDDYPFAGKPHCLIEAGYTCPDGSLNTATTFYYRECVDFAWHRLQQQLGSGMNFSPGSIGAGNAVSWKAAWDRQGWPTSKTPVVGAIAWFDANFSSNGFTTGPMGHVGVVKAVMGDRITIEQYNGMAPPNDHRYSTMEVPAGFASAYLYIPSKSQMGLAA